MKSRKSFLNNQLAKLLVIILTIQSLTTFAIPAFAETSKTKPNLQNQKRQKPAKSKQRTKGYRLIITDYRGKPLISLETQQPAFPQLAASINFTYNQAGFRATMTDASGTTTYNYNTQNRLISKQTPQGTLNYTYDPVGRVTSVRSSNTNGIDLSYTYNDNGLLISVVDNRLPSGNNTTTYTYHTTKILESTTLPNGVKTNYGFDSQDRLTSVTVTKNPVSLASYNYTLGPSGNRLSVQELSGRTVSYTYDSTYQLKSETINNSPNATQNGSINYSYDGVGNRLSRVSSVNGIPSTDYSYDDNDRLISDNYDNNGNTITSSNLGYVYDFEDKLSGVIGAPSLISIVHDGDGNRVSKTVGEETTKYLVDDNNPTGFSQVAEEIKNGVVTKRYTHGIQRICQQQNISGNWQTSFFLYDGHGSVRGLMDSSGNITDSYTYDAFGNTIAQSGNTPNLYLYAGEQFDPDLGLYYNRKRYLNVATGRFWTADTFEGTKNDPRSHQRYIYTQNNPVNFIDPSGNSAVNILAVFTVASIIVNIASAGYHLHKAYYAKDEAERSLEVTYACMDLFAATLAVFGGSIIGPGTSFAFASGTTVTSNGLKLTATSIAIPAITNIFAVRNYPDGSYRSEDGKFQSRTGEPAPGTDKAKNFVQQLRNNGFDVVAEEASVETPLGLRRFDAVIRAADGKLHGLEIKSGTATKGQSQTFIDTFIVNKGGAPGVGKIEGETVHSATTVYIP